MTSKLSYSDKVKASSTIVNAINGLKDNETVIVTYGTDYNGDPRQFRIRCNIFRDGRPSYSIHKNDVFSMDGMNFSEISKTTAKAYTYDMMGQRTTYTFPLYEMEIVQE